LLSFLQSIVAKGADFYKVVAMLVSGIRVEIDV
jgi:hypothetical protein